MVRDLRDRDDLPAADRSFLSNIKKYGWNVTNVFASEGETGPEWSYSTGLYHSFQHAEIAVFGLKIENMHKIINNIGEAVKNGARFEAGNEYHDIFARIGCRFQSVPRAHYKEYFGWGIWFYEQDALPMLQCFWPDRDGRYPWDPRCSPHVASLQPLLFETS